MNHDTLDLLRGVYGDGWSRREFLATVGKGVAAATLLGTFAGSRAHAVEGSAFRPAVSSNGGVVASLNP